jgi:hypothetical protein
VGKRRRRLLHDIGKKIDLKMGRALIEADDPRLVDAPDFSVHQFLGAL